MPFALLLGLIIGGWGPKEELRGVRKLLDEQRAQPSANEKGSRLGDFTRMVQIPERAKKPRSPNDAHSETNAIAKQSGGTGTPGAATSSSTTNTPTSSAAAPDSPPPSPEDLRARIDEAKELWKTRVDVARAQWIDRLKLTEEQAQQFDEAINAMNERMYFAMQDLADSAAASDTLSPETGTRAFSEMTSALAATYDDLHGFLQDEQGQQAANIELTDFIDPGVAEPLIAVQDKIQDARKNGKRGPRLFR